jgi:hypothetical protein
MNLTSITPITHMKTQSNLSTAIDSLLVRLKMALHSQPKGMTIPPSPPFSDGSTPLFRKTGRYEIACRECHQFDGTKMTKHWAKFKAHLKAADRDIRNQETTCTMGYHGAAHAATSNIYIMNDVLLTTTQAALEASDIVLARSISQLSLSSSSSNASSHTAASATTNLSAITTPDTGPRAYCCTMSMCHSIPTWHYPDEGNQLAATASNTMGGTISILVPRRRRSLIKRAGKIYGVS